MNLQELTLTQAAKDLRAKSYSSVELTQATLEHIEKFDPTIKAMVTVTEEKALQAARAFDQKLAQEQVASPLAGIPMTIKDLYNWIDTPTTASSNTLRNYISPYNATVVDRILSAGAVIVGKTNLDAFAHGSSTETSDFFTTHNPWDVNRLPGGSSGGGAAAVIAGMGIAALGTETAGSIRQPSSWCGITGLKPTYGRVSRYGIIAMGSSLDSPGPMAKSAEDCALLLETIAGHDTHDATSSPQPVERYHQNLNATIKGLRIGIPQGYFDGQKIQPAVIARVQTALQELQKLGAVLVDIDLMDLKYGIAVYTVICRSEVSANLGRYDGIRYGHYSDNVAESILNQVAFNRGEGFGQEAKQRSMTGSYALSAGHHDAYYLKAQRVRTMIKNDLDQAYTKVDAIIGPTTACTAMPIGATKDQPLFGEMTDRLMIASTLAGGTGLSVPVGFDENNLPVGMNIFAPQFHEQTVLNIGYAYQQVTDWHKKYPDLSKMTLDDTLKTS